MNFLEEQRHDLLELTHADDRAHRRRQPVDLHGPVRRPSRPAGDELLQDVQLRRVDRPGNVVHLLDVADRRHQEPADRGHDATPSMVYSDHVPATARRHEQDHAGAVGAVHPRRLQCRRLLDREHGAREREGRPADGVRRRIRPRSRSSTPTRIHSRTPRSPTTSARRSTARRATRLCADAQAVKFGQTTPLAVGSARSAADRARRLHTATRRSSARGTSTRRSAPDAERHPQRLPGDGRARESRRPRRQRDQRAVQPSSGLPRVQPGGDAVARRASPTCRRPASRSPTATSPTSTSGRPTRRPAARPPPRPSAAAARPGRLVLRLERAALRRGVPEVLHAPRRGRHQPDEHAVRDQRRGERPVRRRQRRPGDEADAGGLRRRRPRRATTPPARSASCRRTSRACSRPPPRARTRSSTSSRRALALYVHGQPAANDPTVRQLERDTAAMTNPHDPYSGVANEKIAQYQAGALEQRVLHMQTADPLRTPTYTLFPKPDYFFSTSGPNVSINNGFAYDHGYYSPNIDITWVGDGRAWRREQRCRRAVAGRHQPGEPTLSRRRPFREASQTGTWVEETDIRPTMLHLLGLTDDYQSDGHVITQALTSVPARARCDGRPGEGVRPDQLQRRSVRDRHAARRHESARRWLGVRRLRVRDGADDAEATRRRPRSGGDEDQADARERRGRHHAEPRRDPERPRRT